MPEYFVVKRVTLHVARKVISMRIFDTYPHEGTRGYIWKYEYNVSYADIQAIHHSDSLPIHSHVSEVSYATIVYFLSTMLLKYSYSCILFQLYSNY